MNYDWIATGEANAGGDAAKAWRVRREWIGANSSRAANIAGLRSGTWWSPAEFSLFSVKLPASPRDAEEERHLVTKLKGKIALITSGIGAATAKRFQAEGATVVVTGSNPATLEAARLMDV